MEAINNPNFHAIDAGSKQVIQSNEYDFQINEENYKLKIEALSNQTIHFYLKQTNKLPIYYYEKNFAYEEILQSLVLTKSLYNDIAKIFKFCDISITKKKMNLKEEKEKK